MVGRDYSQKEVLHIDGGKVCKVHDGLLWISVVVLTDGNDAGLTERHVRMPTAMRT
jgi:hypothetical protein